MLNWLFKKDFRNSSILDVVNNINIILERIKRIKQIIEYMETVKKESEGWDLINQTMNLKNQLANYIQQHFLNRRIIRNTIELIGDFDKKISEFDKEVNHVKKYVEDNKLMKNLEQYNIVIQTTEIRFYNLLNLFEDLKHNQNRFQRKDQDGKILESLNPKHIDENVCIPLSRIYNYIDKTKAIEIDVQHISNAINSIEIFLKKYIVDLYTLKIQFSEYITEYDLVVKLIKNHKKGKRDEELFESVFGKISKNKIEEIEKDEKNIDTKIKILNNAKGVLNEDQLFRILQRLKSKTIENENEGEDYIRGITDKEATIFASMITPDMLKKIGVTGSHNEYVGIGLSHFIAKHRKEFITLGIAPKDIINIYEKTIRNAKFKLKTYNKKSFLLDPMNKKGNLFFIGINNQEKERVTFYHADDSPSEKGLINSFTSFIELKEGMNNVYEVYKFKNQIDHYIFKLDGEYFIDIMKENEKVNITALKSPNIDKSNLEEVESSNQRKKISKLIKKIISKEFEGNINLSALAA